MLGEGNGEDFSATRSFLFSLTPLFSFGRSFLSEFELGLGDLDLESAFPAGLPFGLLSAFGLFFSFTGVSDFLPFESDLSAPLASLVALLSTGEGSLLALLSVGLFSADLLSTGVADCVGFASAEEGFVLTGSSFFSCSLTG